MASLSDCIKIHLPDKEDQFIADMVRKEARKLSKNGRVSKAVAQAAVKRVIADFEADTAAIERQLEEVASKPAIKANTEYSVDEHESTMSGLKNGTITPSEFKDAFESMIASKDALATELQKYTKENLLKLLGGMGRYQYKNETKPVVAKAVVSSMIDDFVLSGSYSYDPFGGGKESAIRKMVEDYTEKDFEAYRERRKKAIENQKQIVDGYIKSIKNPETLEEFETFIKAKGKDKLTPEQLEKYDTLKADSLKEQGAKALEKKATLGSVGNLPMEIIAGKHTKKGTDIWTVKLGERVDRDVYTDLNTKAKRLGGYYSSFRGNGAIPGFVFNSEDAAQKFMALREGDVSIAEDVKERIGKKRSESAQRLIDMAEKLESKGNEKLNQDRNTNTDRRARMANAAEADARADIAFAKTLRSIATAIDTGEIKYLDKLTQKVQLAELEATLRAAKYEAIRIENKGGHYFEDQKDRPPTKEDVRYAKMPALSMQGDDILRFAEALKRVKNAGARVIQLEAIGKKVNFAQDAKVSFAGRQENIIRDAIKRANEHNKVNTSYDKKVFIPGWIQDAIAKTDRLNRMGIETDEQLRSALRELVDIRSHKEGQDAIKKAERALVGQNVGIDFFPTPKTVVSRMIIEADIQPGMSVLEPSAGKGDIADAVKEETGTAPDVIEISSSLRDVLEAKGYSPVDQDFMEHTGEYDRILMNPPFSKNRDIQHVRHAFENNLKPGGRIVAIMSEHGFFGQEKEAADFREWLDTVGWSEKLPEGSFKGKEAFRETGVASRLVVIDKPSQGETVLKAADFKPVDTESKEFKAWFGKSKVRGKVYHWTDYEFNAFDMEAAGGLVHVGTKQAAVDRARGMDGISYDIDEDEDGFYVTADSGPMQGEDQGPFKTEAEAKVFIKKQPKRIEPIALYAKIENPLRVMDLGMWPFDGVRSYLHREGVITDKEADAAWKAWNEQSDKAGWDSLKNTLRKHGYDGFVYKNEQEDPGSDSYIVFEPTQLKSAATNTGEFSPNNPDIRYKTGDPTPADLQRLDTANQAVIQAMRNAGLTDQLVNRIRVELKPVIDLSTKDAESSIKQWKAQGKRLDTILGATTFNGYSALMELSLAQDLQTLEKTTYHESFHALSKWVLPARVYNGLMRNYSGNEEKAADAFADYVAGTLKPKGIVKIAMARLKNLLNKVGNALRGKGFQAPQDVFRNLVQGKYEAKQGGMYQGSALQSEDRAPMWYSQMQKVLESKLPGSGTPAQIKQAIDGWAKKGEFKAEELEWSGVKEWLDQQTGKVTKQQVIDFVAANNVQIQEVVKGDGKGASPDELSTFESEDADGNGALRLQWSDVDSIYGLSYDGGKTFDMFDDSEFVSTLPENDAEAWVLESIEEQFPHYLNKKEVGDTKFSQYQLPGGDNYREVLLTLPSKPDAQTNWKNEWVNFSSRMVEKYGDEWASYDFRKQMDDNDLRQLERLEKQSDEYGNIIDRSNVHQYQSSHWDEPNVLAHVRFNDRTGPNGERILFLEEVQSDWHQAGRKDGYGKTIPKVGERFVSPQPGGENLTRLKDNKGQPQGFIWVQNDSGSQFYLAEALFKKGVPDAPFKKTWPMLAMKRMVRYAAENGFDSIAWTPGEVQAERYDLSKQVQSISAEPADNGRYDIEAVTIDGKDVRIGEYDKDQLEEAVGKDLAAKIIRDVTPDKEDGVKYEGLDLKVGGEGMKGFYDKILPAEVNAFFGKKAWGGAKVGTIDIDTTTNLNAPQRYVGPEFTLDGLKEFRNKYRKDRNSNVTDEKHLDDIITDMRGGDSFMTAASRTSRSTAELLGGRLEFGKLPGQKAWTMPITPEMRTKALREGMSLFKVADAEIPTVVAAFNEEHPGHSLRYDGIQEGFGSIPSKYQFTAYDGPARGATFLVDSADIDAIKSKLDEMVKMRRGTTQLKIAETLDKQKSVLSDHFDKAMYFIVDKNRPIQSVQNELKTVREDIDLFMKETQRPKITASNIQQAWDTLIDPLIKKMGKYKVELQDLELYKHALHAPEANDHLRKVNAKRQVNKIITALEAPESGELARKVEKTEAPEDWYDALNEAFDTYGDNESVQKIKAAWDKFAEKPSGMTDKEAAEVLERYDGDEKIQELGAMLDAINEKRLEYLSNAGQLSDETYEAFKKTYQHYIPLMREGYEDSLFGPARGLKPSGRAIKVRGGSTRDVVNILANSIANLEKAINIAEKARSQRALYGLIKANPENDILELQEVKKSPRYDTDGNLQMYPNLNDVGSNEIRLMIDGRQFLVVADRDNKNAMLMMRTLKASDNYNGAILNTLAKVNRFLARINTSWSPEFMFTNFPRDLQTAMVNVKDTGVEGKKMFSGAISAARSIYKYETGKDRTSDMAKLYKLYKDHGGKIGWADVHDSVTNLTKKLERDIAVEQGKRPVLKKVRQVVELIENANTAVENGIRLHVFKLAMDSGKFTADKAAQIASDITVDFTKKGAAGPVINSLYLFANAGIQGSYRIMRAAATSSRVRKTLAGIVGAGFAVGMLNSIFGGEDDDDEKYINKVEDYTLERNMVFVIPGMEGKIVKIPLPWGYNLFWNMGHELSRMITQKNYKPFEGMARMGSTMFNAFNPLQSGTLLQTLAPTIADPFAQVAENKNWFGGDLMPAENKFDKTPAPDSQRYWKSTGEIPKQIAYRLNKLTGGDVVEKGFIDVSPETIELVADTVGGSAVRFVKDMVGLPIKLYSGNELTAKNIPFVRRFVGDQSEYVNQKIYYNNIQDVLTAKDQLEAYKGTAYYNDLVKEKALEKKMIPVAEGYEKKLRRLRKQLKEAEAQNDRQRQKELKKTIEGVYLDFNKQFNK